MDQLTISIRGPARPPVDHRWPPGDHRQPDLPYTAVLLYIPATSEPNRLNWPLFLITMDRSASSERPWPTAIWTNYGYIGVPAGYPAVPPRTCTPRCTPPCNPRYRTYLKVGTLRYMHIYGTERACPWCTKRYRHRCHSVRQSNELI